MPEGAQHPAPCRARRLGRGRLWASRLDELAPQPGGLGTRPDQLGLDGGELPLGLVGLVVLLVGAFFGAISPGALLVRPLLGLVGALFGAIAALLGSFEPLA